MKKFFLLLMGGVIASAMMAGIPDGYYNSAKGKQSAELKTALHDIVIDHTILSYNDLWKYFPTTDCYPDNTSKVWDMYSNTEYTFNGTSSVSGMHKEHSFPKSWWGGSTDANQYPSYTDLHHLYPADGTTNTSKSNWPLGEVNTSGTVTLDNGVSKVGEPVSGQGGGAAKVFEPADEYKGDFARTYFYMVTCYQDYSWASSYSWMLQNFSDNYTCLQDWAIDMLLAWSRNDPVSEKETARNEAVYGYQNNRNPYIDHPELVEYVFGNKAGNVWNGTDSTVTVPTLTEPANGSTIDLGIIASTGTSVSKTVTVQGSNLSQALTVSVSGTGFSVSTGSLTAGSVNSGTTITVTYTGSEANATGTLTLASGEVSSTVTLTAGKAQQDDEDTFEFQMATTVTAGKRYLIVADNSGTLTAMVPVNPGKTYQYPLTATVTATNGVIILQSDTLAYTLEAANGGFYIKDHRNRYYYQSGTYKTVNASTTLSTDYVWTVTPGSDGTFTISDNGYSLQYNSQYTSYGVYTTSTGILPALYEEVEHTVTPTNTDINDDGAWSMADVTTLIAYVLGNNPSPCLTENCDVNGDGNISMADVTTLIAQILGN